MRARLIKHHDQFFKRLLDKPGTAAALLRERLPPEIAALLSDDPPELIPGTLIPPVLRARRTDRLYQARTRTGRPLLFHVVIEHKSYPDRGTPLQLLFYKAEYLQWWAADRKARKLPAWPVPAVVSLVVYHGRSRWCVPMHLAGATDADAALHPWLADFRYVLFDLGPIPNAELSADQTLRTGLLILKYGTRPGDLREILLELCRLALAQGWDDLVALICYLFSEVSEVEEAFMRKILAEVIPGQEEHVMSVAARRWLAEGRAEGVAEGRRKEKIQSVLRLLEHRFGTVSEALRHRIDQADLETLDRWFDRAIDAVALDAVFDGDSAH